MKKKNNSTVSESLSQSNSLTQQQERMLEAEIKQREASIKQMELTNVGNRIEFARRNVEVIGKTWLSLIEKSIEGDLTNRAKEVVMLNLEILKETSKL